MLNLHALETAELIHQYYIEKYEHQKSMSKAKYGQLTVRGKIVDNELNVSFTFVLGNTYSSLAFILTCVTSLRY